MKRLRNEFFKHLHYLCLAGVIALGLMTIVATTDNNGGVAPVAPGGPAAPSGTLDTTFGGGNGFVVNNNAAGGNGADAGNFITTGSIFIAGFSTNAVPDIDIVVWEYNTDGTLNANFGNNGIFVFDSMFGIDFGFSITTDANGNILVTGLSAALLGVNMAVLRLTPNGMLDPTFGVGGLFLITSTAGAAPFGFDQGNGITIDANGNIVVTGNSLNANPDLDMAVWRILPNGMLDPAFGGGNGFIVFDGGNGADIGASVKIDANGNIVVTGNSTNAAGDTDMVTWRLLPNGMLDPAFGGGNGFIVHDDAAGGNNPGMNNDAGFNIACDANGNILVTGNSTNAAGDTDMVVWRLLPNGMLDPAFGGGNGFVVFDGGNGGDAGNSIIAGSIFVAGFITNAAGDTDMAVWDFNTDGTLNANFGNNGIFVHDDAAGGNNPGMNADQGTSLTIDANNRILVSGFSTNAAGDTDQVIWRLE